MLRHVNAEVRTLAGLVLAALSRNDPDKSTYKGPERRKSRQKAAAKDEGGENEATKPAQTGS